MRGATYQVIDPSRLTGHETDRHGFEWREQGRKMNRTNEHRGSTFRHLNVVWCMGSTKTGIRFRKAKRNHISQFYTTRYNYNTVYARQDQLDRTDRR